MNKIILLLALVCVGNFSQLCFNPDLVIAVYEVKSEYGRSEHTVIELSNGTKIKTIASVDEVMQAINDASTKKETK